jgi:5-methylcytosine-specific restriction endonuclease McrA
MKFNYRDYIISPEWRAKSDAMKWLAGYRCQVCNRHKSEVTLNTHHRTYERLGQEIPSDLTVLCEHCHALFEHARSGESWSQHVKQQEPLERRVMSDVESVFF